MNRLVAGCFTFVFAAIVSISTSNAAIVFHVIDNMDYNGTGGTFSIAMSGDESISAFDLQLQFDTYTGANQSLPGATITLNSETTFNGASKVTAAGNQDLSTVTTDPSTLQRNSFQWVKTLDATVTTFATYSYTGNGGAFPEDNYFTVTVLPNNGIENDGIGTELQNFTLFPVPSLEIIPDSRITFASAVIGRASAVPEPSSLFACMLLVGTVTMRRRKR